MSDRDFVYNLIDRAKAAKCSALVLTLDLQILGQRHKDLRNGLSAPPKFTPKHIWQMATRPRWCLRHAGHAAPHLPQHRRPRQGRRRPRVAVVLDHGAVRPAAVVEGRRVDQGALGRQADPEGHPRRRGCRDGGADAAPTRSSSPTMAAASSTARRPRSRCCPRSSTRSATGSRSTWTAASAPARTC